MAHVYGYLARPAEEDAIHAERLLFIEERPFARVTKRLTSTDSFLRSTPKQLPSPPPEGEVVEDVVTDPSALAQKFREEVLTDFAALESSITRIQLIQLSNSRERERYAAEKAKIQASAQAVRENTLRLREQLSEAQRLLQLRKGYDAMAAKILDQRKLKSRDEARADISTLEKEIEELQAESQEGEALWDVRREAFEKVVVEGKAFVRLIKGVKDTSEEDDKQDEDVDMAGEGSSSNVGTPRPDGNQTPLSMNGGATPLPGEEMAEDANTSQPTQSRLRQVDTIAEDSQVPAQMPDTNMPDSAATDSREVTDEQETTTPAAGEASQAVEEADAMDET